MLKLTIPTRPGLYAGLAADPRVLRVLALSGGYSRDDACALLAKDPSMIASFSRALLEGLTDRPDRRAVHRPAGRLDRPDLRRLDGQDRLTSRRTTRTVAQRGTPCDRVADRLLLRPPGAGRPRPQIVHSGLRYVDAEGFHALPGTARHREGYGASVG